MIRVGALVPISHARLGQFGLVLAGFILTTLSGFAGESPYKPGPAHYYCISQPQPKTRYYSGAFDATAGDASTKAATAFQQFLKDKYGFDNPAACFGNHPSLQAAQTDMQKEAASLKNISKWTVVQTGWKYSGGTSTAGGNHPDCNSSDGWKSVAEYKAACEGQAQSAAAASEAAPAGNESAQNAAAGGASTAASNAPAATAGAQGETAALSGSTLAVRMTEAVDSAKGGMGREYRAMVVRAADAGTSAIPPGSVAMVKLVKNQAGWVAQLSSVMVKGQTMSISSGPATLTNSAQGMAAGAMNTVSSLFGGFKKQAGAAAAAQAVASGERVVLPPGTQLRFVVNGASAAPGAGFGGAGMASPAAAGPSASIPNGSTAAAAGGTLKAKISEVRLGPAPNKAGGKYVVSPDGGHYAAFSMHGSREVIVVDGADGPEFDHAGHGYTAGGIDVSFNADGKHAAYIAQSGDSLVAVVDGKTHVIVEQAPPNVGASADSIPRINTALNYPPARGIESAALYHQVLLSPSGLHYACVAPHLGATGSHMVLDSGKGAPMMNIDLNQVAFVNEQLIYAGMISDHNWHVVVNDKLGPEYQEVQSLRVTPDGKHYAFIANVKGSYMVVVDGKAGTLRQLSGNHIYDLTLASNGRVAFVGDLPLGGDTSHGMATLFVDDREISRDIKAFETVDRAGNHVQHYTVFSPDGARFAYAKKVPGGVAAVIDGKVGRAYDGMGLTEFSPDSKHAFSVGVRGQSFVVVDGKEMPGVNRLDNFVWSNDGTRFAYQAYSQDGNHVVIDGKESPRYYNVIGNSLSFSADAKHYIYGACTNIMKCEVVRDGVSTPVPALSEFSTRLLKPAYVFPPAFFSPDSNQVAYAYSKSDGTGQTVYFVNGQELLHGTTFEFPSFSPDSKHFVAMGWNGHAYSLFADGKMGPGFQDMPEANLNVARFEDAHTYRYLAIKDDSVYRVTVDLATMN